MPVLGAVPFLLRATLEMALPTTCGGCGFPGKTWCDECADEAGRIAYPDGPRQVRPTPCPQACPPTWAATPYAGPVALALVAFKDGNRRDLEAVLAPLLSAAMALALARDPALRSLLACRNGPVLVVPVPSSRSALRRRGDSPQQLLTAAASAQTGHCERDLILSPALRLRRRVADQSGLNHSQRAGNLERAMQVHPRWRTSVQGASCLVVDDVLTTGATLVEAARALRAGGAVSLVAVTVAATQRRGIPTL